ncbi:MAG: SCP2 sterol-binding domain-containing protein [Candidatus Hodarchaeales archaeon]|jgi:putative sterol carrier protein
MADEEYIAMVNKLRGNFLTDKSKKTFRKWNKTMAFEFTDLEKIFYFNIEVGTPNEIIEGEPEKADIKIITDSVTWVGVMKGEIGGMKAYTSRKLKVKGRMPDLLKLQKLMK